MTLAFSLFASIPSKIKESWLCLSSFPILSSFVLHLSSLGHGLIIEDVTIVGIFSNLESKFKEFQCKVLNCILFSQMRNFFLLALRNLCTFCPKGRIHRAPTLSVPARNLPNFGNTSCPVSETMTFTLEN